ncbi:MAG: hypothetical protein GF311_18720 [Candidatus Lokiarchaeota archaeon]|nr:hypothetical protein [Candidatus Lokiarchaeota archaeon]
MDEIEKHYIIWWLGRFPSQQDFNIVNDLLEDLDANIVSFKKYVIKYRIYLTQKLSYHIILYRKNWGFSINIHLDIGIHTKAIFTKQPLTILSMLYLEINKANYGECFILPR